ncbi:hypothetical protein AFE_0464 [Acidithiobacillus ferrooxidans ATCC 23270]|uniref:Uncharacterized protein n=1 Tax=Acidithiobacillus ferrooxidans (strain ATCC 23270 / DSM 14882 / CIP 104768 / NCIMB 8455) TaxID=243159 RepID=B7J4K7_ACIF2|nr:hypothetical protein AFE_0464 [Acidithiobacillus ferrooxidans ATCC 23270]
MGRADMLLVLPGQAAGLPAVYLAALAMGVVFALETTKDVIAMAVAQTGQMFGRSQRTATCAAEQEQKIIRLSLPAQFCIEIGVGRHARIQLPRHMAATFDKARKIQLRVGTHVNEDGLGMVAQHGVCFLRGEVPGVAFARRLRPFLCFLQNRFGTHRSPCPVTPCGCLDD